MTNRLSSYASSASIESYLEKHGGLVASFMTKKFWFVLNDGRLSYFKDSTKASAPLGSIDVAKVQSVRMSSTKGFCFEIVSGSKTQVYAAASADLRDQWIKSLQDAMSIASRRLSSISVRPVSDWNNFAEEEPDSISTSNPVKSVNMESSIAGSDPSSTVHRQSTSDASSSRVSHADISSTLPGKGSIKRPVVKDTDGSAALAQKLNESTSQSNYHTSVEPSHKTSLSPDELIATPVPVVSDSIRTPHGSSTCFRFPSVIDPVGVLDSTNGTGDSDTTRDLPTLTPVVLLNSPAAETALNGVKQVHPEKPVNEVIEPDDNPPKPASSTGVRRPSTLGGFAKPATENPVVELVIDNSFEPSVVPQLQHAPLESENKSSFEEIKSFIAQFHRPSTSYIQPDAAPRSSSYPGQAIHRLKFSLENLE